MDLLEVETHERSGWIAVTVRGQLDVATAPDFQQALMQAQFDGSSRVVVDLGGVEFLDSMGLGVIVGAIKRARTQAGEIALAAPNDRVRQVLESSGVAEIVPVVGAVEDVTGPGGQ